MINTVSWHVILDCGKELHGKDIGSYANIKHRADIFALYVITGAGKVFAERRPGNQKPVYDFYVHMAITEGGNVEKHYKLITIYPDCKFIKHVFEDGRSYTEVERWR